MKEAPKKETKVLVVDDNEDLRKLTRLRLDPYYDISTASTGKECLESLSDDVDVIILDRKMPGITGDKTASKIRDSPYSPVIIMMSANIVNVDILDVHCDDYIKKPVDKSELLSAIERVLALPTHEPQLRRYYSLQRKVQTLRDATHRCFSTTPEFQQTISELQSLRNHLPKEQVCDNTATTI